MNIPFPCCSSLLLRCWRAHSFFECAKLIFRLVYVGCWQLTVVVGHSSLMQRRICTVTMALTVLYPDSVEDRRFHINKCCRVSGTERQSTQLRVEVNGVWQPLKDDDKFQIVQTTKRRLCWYERNVQSHHCVCVCARARACLLPKFSSAAVAADEVLFIRIFFILFLFCPLIIIFITAIFI